MDLAIRFQIRLGRPSLLYTILVRNCYRYLRLVIRHLEDYFLNVIFFHQKQSRKSENSCWCLVMKCAPKLETSKANSGKTHRYFYLKCFSGEHV